MYFNSRQEAGQRLASELASYINSNCTVIALSEGAVQVGEQIAIYLNCGLDILLSEEIKLPGEPGAIGVVSQDGSFVYNHMYSAGEIEEYYSEFHAYIDDQKRQKFAEINRLLGCGGLLDPKSLHDHVIILVSDGLKNGMSLEAAKEFLKPVRISRLVVATPIASVQAVDKMHVLADELHCLAVTNNYIKTDHYYTVNDMPTREQVIEKIKNYT
ncbi:MAG: phosphoribosyltransferase family protein [Candidatus Woesebacteria bacterium]|jgi:predicted phosphoribosyltransferase